ncbi:MAG: type IV secretion system protein [Acidobacteriota bacterium]|nr:type IV secretion system protein [Acidobacteriota bacterium]
MRKLRLLSLLLLPVAALAQQSSPSAPLVDQLGWLDQTIMQLVTNKGNLFVTVGWEEFVLFAGFAWVFFLIRTAAANRRHYLFDFEGLITLLGKTLFVALFLSTYFTPIAAGISLHQLPMTIAHGLAEKVTQGMLDPLLAKIHDVSTGIQKPSALNLLDVIVYLMTLGDMAIVSMVLFAINGYAYLAVGILTLLGPLFAPLFLTQHFGRYFFKWIDLLIAYSMLGVTIAAFTYVWTFFFMKLFEGTIGNDYSNAHFLSLTGALLAMVGSFFYMAFKLPSFNAELFSGAGGMGASAAASWGGQARKLIRSASR